MSFEDYYTQVKIEAIRLGYKAQQVAIFRGEVMDCYYNGKSVDECIEEVF